MSRAAHSPRLPKPRSACTISRRGAVRVRHSRRRGGIVGEIRRISLNAATLRILIEAEMSKYPPECGGCTEWSLEACDPDERGCNWQVKHGPAANSRCFARCSPYISILKENFSLDDRWHG